MTAKKPPQLFDAAMNSQAPIAVKASPPGSLVNVDFNGLLRHAIERGPEGVEVMERLCALMNQQQDRQAAAECSRAMARFHEQCPQIERDAVNHQFLVVNRNGVKRPSRYAKLDTIAQTIRKPLVDNGLSYTWRDAEVSEGTMKLTCVIFHEAGHSIETSATFPVESKAGASPQQKHAATVTYLQRYTLINALGLTTCDDDVDGAGSAELISEWQEVDLSKLIGDVGADRAKFLKFLGVDKLSELRASQYARAVDALESKRRSTQ